MQSVPTLILALSDRAELALGPCTASRTPVAAAVFVCLISTSICGGSGSDPEIERYRIYRKTLQPEATLRGRLRAGNDLKNTVSQFR